MTNPTATSPLQTKREAPPFDCEAFSAVHQPQTVEVRQTTNLSPIPPSCSVTLSLNKIPWAGSCLNLNKSGLTSQNSTYRTLLSAILGPEYQAAWPSAAWPPQMRGIQHALERQTQVFQKMPELTMMLRGLQDWMMRHQQASGRMKGLMHLQTSMPTMLCVHKRPTASLYIFCLPHFYRSCWSLQIVE